MLWLGTAAAGAVLGGGIDLAIQLYQHNGNFSCVNGWQVAAAAAGGALLSGLGPEGFLLGRGGARAAEFGYPEISGALNNLANRFGWGYNQSLDANVLRGVVGGSKFDVPKIAISPLPNVARTAVPAGIVSGTGVGLYGNR